MERGAFGRMRERVEGRMREWWIDGGWLAYYEVQVVERRWSLPVNKEVIKLNT